MGDKLTFLAIHIKPDYNMSMENEPLQTKKDNYLVEITFAILVFLWACPLIPFLITFIHPRFIPAYIALLPFELLFAAILLVVSVTRLLVGLRKTPKASGIRAVILVPTVIFGFLLVFTIPWWDAAAEGIYLNLKSADFTELRNWAQSVQYPEGENYLHVSGKNIPVAAAKFRPLSVWVHDLDNQKGRTVSIVWCGGALVGYVYLIVGPPDVPVPEPVIRPNYREVHKTVSPGVYISISG
jgi:hypothetical protein